MEMSAGCTCKMENESIERIGKQDCHRDTHIEIQRIDKREIMPIVIKEIHVNTVVEKKVILPGEVSEQLYLRLKEQIVEELSVRDSPQHLERGRKER